MPSLIPEHSGTAAAYSNEAWGVVSGQLLVSGH